MGTGGGRGAEDGASHNGGAKGREADDSISCMIDGAIAP